MAMIKWSLPCKCGDAGNWQIMYQQIGDEYAISYRCANCGREYRSIEDIIDSLTEK